MKYLIIKKNIKIDVSDEVYSLIRNSHYREKYAITRDTKHKLIHYHAFDTESSDGENLIRDRTVLPDEIVISNDVKNALYNALATLSIEDQLLLYNLYVKEESIRNISVKESINAMAISRHRDKLFKKLARLLIKYKV